MVWDAQPAPVLVAALAGVLVSAKDAAQAGAQVSAEDAVRAGVQVSAGDAVRAGVPALVVAEAWAEIYQEMLVTGVPLDNDARSEKLAPISYFITLITQIIWVRIESHNNSCTPQTAGKFPANLPAFLYNSIEKKNTASDHSGVGCARTGHRTNIQIFRNLETYEIVGEPYSTQTHWMLVFDNETGKAVKIIPSGYDIKYTIHEKESLNSVVYSDEGPQEDSQTSDRTRELSFELGPVGEEIDDPTIKRSDTWIQDYLKNQGVELPPGVEIPQPSNEEAIEKIPPDILVKTGDGKTSFGGDGERPIRIDLEHGFEEVRMHYNWNMTRRKK